MFRAVAFATLDFAALIIAIATPATTYSQAVSVGDAVVGQAVGNAYNPYGYYGGYGGHASTAAEGYYNGIGNVIQSAGSYNLQTSQAAINVEQARKMNIDNRLLGTQTYFEMRKVNQAATKAEQLPGLTTEDTWRIAQANMPKRMTQMQLDPVTGRIYWPMELQAPQFGQYRKSLDKLFVQRETAHGGIGYDTYTQIQDIANSMLADLDKNIAKYPTGDYVKMKNFIESLAYEAKFPAV
ncbi:MAG TPA: hypothetical protein VGI75_07670 [Pirellulales bacterium]|jgi:hypothetical protein